MSELKRRRHTAKTNHCCNHDHDHNHHHHEHAHHHDHLEEGVHVHDHSHSHGHHHPLPSSGGRLALVTLLNIIITAAELVGGILGGSLALVSDAVHNFGDGLALVLAWAAAKIGRKPADQRYTFGFKRAEIMAAFINGMFLMVVSLYLLYEAGLRWLHPQPVQGGMVLIVAALGLLANLAGAALLFRGSHHSLNMRASYLHLLSDTLSSVVVVIGAVLFMLGVTPRLDAVLTAGLSLYMLWQGFGVLRQCGAIFMQSAPSLDFTALQNDLSGLPGVLGIHHVHLWYLDEKSLHFEAHVDVQDMPVSNTQELSLSINKLLTEKYHITHAVLQFENCTCADRKVIVDCQS